MASYPTRHGDGWSRSIDLPVGCSPGRPVHTHQLLPGARCCHDPTHFAEGHAAGCSASLCGLLYMRQSLLLLLGHGSCCLVCVGVVFAGACTHEQARHTACVCTQSALSSDCSNGQDADRKQRQLHDIASCRMKNVARVSLALRQQSGLRPLMGHQPRRAPVTHGRPIGQGWPAHSSEALLLLHCCCPTAHHRHYCLVHRKPDCVLLRGGQIGRLRVWQWFVDGIDASCRAFKREGSGPGEPHAESNPGSLPTPDHCSNPKSRSLYLKATPSTSSMQQSTTASGTAAAGQASAAAAAQVRVHAASLASWLLLRLEMAVTLLDVSGQQP